ncbi:MAG: multidrug efflux RND transporter permease subunit [Acidobacteriaceae bacterium]|nr:multidrug efflux RND transporter permease subunit [Acidobacteriaceae bacterium]
MARFFINKPILAVVVALVIILLGSVIIPNLPIAAYPEVVPPVVQVTAVYQGANAVDLERSVSVPIEQQLTGLDGMMYYFARASNNGVLSIDLTFELGTDPDAAAVKVQNKVSTALPLLPPEVQRMGVTTKKVSSAFLLFVALTSKENRYNSLFLNNYAAINLVDRIGGLPGVGSSTLAGQESYAMRIWVNPDKMATLGLTATDINNAIQAQNRQNPAGAIGQPPMPRRVDFQYPVNASGRLATAEEFRDIVVRAAPDSSLLRVGDVGQVQLGSQDYSSFTYWNGRESAFIIVNLAPGANALQTEREIVDFMEQAKKDFPAGLDYAVPYDSTRFVTTSISEVLHTLFEAIALVILVVFIFLQNWRATLIPLLTVPVSVIGTFALFPLLGFSINTTSLFGLVLAIGIVVDDAIVVVEAVQYNIDRGMSPREATIHAMDEVSGPVVAIACILSAVFVPVAFLGGISGQIYKQFALTIAVSVLLSAFSALSLSPALSAFFLKPRSEPKGALGWLFGRFNSGFDWTRDRYMFGVRGLIRKGALAAVALVAVYLFTGLLFKKLPAGFLPAEDQGVFISAVRLPDGASVERNLATSTQVQQVLMTTPGIHDSSVIGGLDTPTSTTNSNVTTVFATLDPWEERTGKNVQLESILASVQQRYFGIKDGFTFAFSVPPILGLGTSGGFEFMLEDRAGHDFQALAEATDNLVGAANHRPELRNVFSTFRDSVPQYKVEVNRDRAAMMGIPVPELYQTLQTFLGGLYVNDFNRFGRTWRVYLEAEPQFRADPADIGRFFVRTSSGDMVPLGTLVTVTRTVGPDVIYRYNRYRAVKIMGSAAPGYSSGQAAEVMEQLAKQLPPGFGYEWTGTLYEQKLSEGKEGYTFGLAAVLVFLFLAALYGSWTLPFSVILAVPLGIFGALFGIFLRSYDYDIYTQIGIVTLIGLAAKNAILIVEMAKLRHEEGKPIQDAAIEAAQLRLRPILMTSFAFILGVLPLVIATGAGAAARRGLGTTVFSGMLAATLLAVFVVPVLYVLVNRWVAASPATKQGPIIAEPIGRTGGSH